MHPKSVIFILIMLSLLLAGGCTAHHKNNLKAFESPAERYTEEYLQQGRICEDRGDLVAALKQYTLALTVSPSNGEALEGRDRIKKLIERSAEAYYQKGLSLKQQGKYGLAGKEFLKALRLWQGYPEALTMLMDRERFEVKGYILHKIKPGESLAMVADFYYGDYRKFPIIAKYNYISDATRIRAGEMIKVPELEGVAFMARALEVKNEAQTHPDAGLSDSVEYPREIEQEKDLEEIQTDQDREEEQITLYLDLGVNLFQEQRYQEALEEFKKVLRVYPESEVAADYLYRLHLNLAGELLERNEYLPARAQFKEALRYNETCEACRGGIFKSENFYKDYHYKKGIQHFGNEQLLEAIGEWELVTALDPNYKRTEDLIKKARTILKNIEAIRATKNNENIPGPLPGSGIK